MPAESFSYETLLDNLPDGIYLVDQQLLITYWNSGAERITGHKRDDVLGTVCGTGFLVHVDRDGNPAYDGKPLVAMSVEDGATFEEEVFLMHKEGHTLPVFTRVRPILNSLGETIGALEVFSDNRSKFQALERIQELEEMALLCPLTEVGNRRYTEMALKDSFEELRRYDRKFGLLFVDIDHFKAVNDEYGHHAGDEILRMVARALRQSLRSFDFVGRWGGEEFVVILPNITRKVLGTISERCRRLIEEARYDHEGTELGVTVSIGGTPANPEETSVQCIERADALMYRSKHEGRNRVSLDR